MHLRKLLSVIAICCFTIAPKWAFAQTTPEVNNSTLQISGHHDKKTSFVSTLNPGDIVDVNLDIGDKRVIARIDYSKKLLSIKSVYASSNVPAKITIAEIAEFQDLLQSLPKFADTSTRHGEALVSLINLLANSPINYTYAIGTNDVQSAAAGYTSICGKIGDPTLAKYTLKKVTRKSTVTVGPVCYMSPALGRCGAGGGPDPAIGLVQRFTQQCLNHDQCCAASHDRIYKIGGKKVNVCGFSGTDCVPEFLAASYGFFFAPDCGTTEGKWTDIYSFQYSLSGGDSSGKANKFTGTVSTGARCGVWNINGTRTGKGILFTATNPRGASSQCAASFQYTGTYTDCGSASGSWTNSGGGSGSWSWERTNVVGAAMSLVSTSRGPSPTDP